LVEDGEHSKGQVLENGFDFAYDQA